MRDAFLHAPRSCFKAYLKHNKAEIDQYRLIRATLVCAAGHSEQGHLRFADAMATLLPQQAWKDAQHPACQAMHEQICRDFEAAMQAFAANAAPLWIAPCAAAPPPGKSPLDSASTAKQQQGIQARRAEAEELERQELEWQGKVTEVEQRAAALHAQPAGAHALGDPDLAENIQGLCNQIADTKRALEQCKEQNQALWSTATRPVNLAKLAEGTGGAPVDVSAQLHRLA